ncbi:MAG: hypothetical protein IPI67_30005 [Myxococcales bacterium]|nr:hypothetical protein [Myxococcales bacterium]
MSRKIWLGVLAIALGAGCSGACTSEGDGAKPKPDDAGNDTGVGGSSGAGSDAGAGGTPADSGDADAPCIPPPKPDFVPDGWDAYTDFSCAQPFYVPSSEKYLPEPILWEPCPSPSLLSKGCQWMKVTWADPTALQIAKLAPSQSGPPLLSFMRIVRPEGGAGHSYSLVAEANGAIRFALLNPRTPQEGTVDLIVDVNEDRFAVEVAGGEGYKQNAFDSDRRGVLIGKLGELRPTLFHFEVTPSVYSWRVSGKLAVRGEAPALRLTAFPLDGAPAFELASPSTDPDGLPPHLPVVLGDNVLFDVGTLLSQGIMVHDPVLKTQALVRWYGDTSKGAYNVGTDGKDLVWTYGEVHPPTGGSYEKRSVWTSPFTTDPAKLVPKRLRSDPETAFDVNFVVGCGYAAHKLQPPDGMLVVRLSDGVSWILPNNLTAADKTGWHWQKGIGITCDEVFATVAVISSPTAKLVYTVARVRLDALGPGVPPD